MASTYVNDLRLNEMATGDQSGSWGTVTNTNLELIAEAFSYGTEAITTNADTHTTTIADGATDPGRSMFLKYTGTLDSACTITIGPNTVSKLWFIENATSELGGSLDGMINNAGITQDNLAIRMSLDEWQKVININLTSTFLMSKFAIKKMLKNKSGKIVNITSVVGHTGNLGQANYTASKAGIVAMSKSLAIEYAKKNININCISPGFIKTAMTDKLDDKFKEAIISKIPSARLGDPDDIANAVLYLASDMGQYVNGETLLVDGGMIASRKIHD